ncbi:unnamed protein product, partial [Brenthis ino]
MKRRQSLLCGAANEGQRRRRTQSTLKIGGRCSPALSRAPHYLYKILKTRRPALRALIARAHSIAVPLRPLSVIKLASPRLVATPPAGGARGAGGGRERAGGRGDRPRSVPATVDRAVARAFAELPQRYKTTPSS